MTLQNNLKTIELNDTNYRNIINSNIDLLGFNRINVVKLNLDLPIYEFKKNRFFYVEENKKMYYDDGYKLNILKDGTEIEFNVNDANKLIYINETGTGLDYKIPEPTLVNGTIVSSSILLGTTTSNSVQNLTYVGKTQNSITLPPRGTILGNTTSSNSYHAITIGYKAKTNCWYYNNSNEITIGKNATQLLYTSNSNANILIGSNSYNAKNLSNSINGNSNITIGHVNKITGYSNNTIIIGCSNKNENVIKNFSFNNIIGNNIEFKSTKSFIFAANGNNKIENSHSFNYSFLKDGFNNKSKIAVNRSAINSTNLIVLPRLNQDSTSTKLKILKNNFFNIKFRLKMFKNNVNIDTNNQEFKEWSGNVNGYCNYNNLVIVKKNEINIDYNGIGFENMNINFLSSSLNDSILELYFSTNGLNMNLEGEIDLSVYSNVDYTSLTEQNIII